MSPSLAALEDLLLALGVQPAEIQRLYTLPHDEASRHLGVLKERVRQNWRKLAFELHPDRTGNDPQKTERFRALLALKSKFEQMTLPEPRPARSEPVPTYATVTPMPPTPGVVYGQVRVRPPRPQVRRTGHVAANMKP